MKFENISILKGDLTKEEKEMAIKKFEKFFQDENMKINSIEDLGLKKLAYSIGNYNEGNYVLCKFSSESEKIGNLERFLRQNDDVIKFITLKTEQENEEENEEEDEL